MTGRKWMLWLALAGLSVAGCGGGGGDLSFGPPASADQQLLAFVSAGGEIRIFDPQNPAASAVTADTGLDVANGPNVVRAVVDGSYNFSDNSLADGHITAVVYVKQGQVFRINLARTALQTPVRVSAVTDACRIAAVFYDFANPDNSRIQVETAGIDTDCLLPDDNGARYFALGASAATAGTDVPADRRIVDSVYGANGALQHVLVRDGAANSRALVRYTASLGNPVTIATLADNSTVDFGGPEPDGNLFYFHLQPTGSAAGLYRYNAASNSLGGPIAAYTNPGLFFNSDADATHVYYATGNAAYRRAHDDSSSTTIRNTGPDILDLRLSAGRVILNGVGSGGGYSLESLPLAGGTPVALIANNPNPLSLVAVAGNHAYAVDGTATEATAVRDDGGEKLVFPDSGWGGFSISTSRWSLGGRNAHQDAHHGVLGQADINYNVTVTSFNAQTRTPIATLGTIPLATKSSIFAFGRYRLTEVTVYRPNTFTTDADVYYSDTLTGGSLRALAATVGANDFIAR